MDTHIKDVSRPAEQDARRDGEPVNPVCDIQNLDTIAALHQWATTHHTTVTYLGPTLENQPTYGATHGHHTRVAVAPGPNPHPPPLMWRSPLEPG